MEANHVNVASESEPEPSLALIHYMTFGLLSVAEPASSFVRFEWHLTSKTDEDNDTAQGSMCRRNALNTLGTALSTVDICILPRTGSGHTSSMSLLSEAFLTNPVQTSVSPSTFCKLIISSQKLQLLNFLPFGLPSRLQDGREPGFVPHPCKTRPVSGK